MKITQHREDGINLIRRYGADFVAIGDREIRESCIVAANSLTPWAPRFVEELDAGHFAPLFALEPEVVVLATGARQSFPRAALRAEFATRKIGLEVMEIGAACRTYNVLVGELRKVVAAILLPGPSKGPE
ncbi:MAG TPA: Mth938-like domain-containing protein [Steroidobacteraceae bacterium]